ncbi:MAG: adenylate/guanylate cyclase domain-containing protein [Elusimicrobiota bacterium]
MKKKRTLYAILVGIPLLVILLSILNVGRIMELKLIDWRFVLRGEKPISGDVFLLAIDDASVSPEGFGRWPWRRGYVAAIVDILRAYEPKALVFDILFTEPSEEFPEDDLLLAEMSMKMGRVYYPFYCIPAESENIKGYTDKLHPTNQKIIEKISLGRVSEYSPSSFIRVSKLVMPIPLFSSKAKSSGFVNSPSDNDGVIRRVPLVMQYKGHIIPNICFEAAMDYLDVNKKDVTIRPGKYISFKGSKGEMKIPVDRKCRMLVNHPGKFKPENIPMKSVIGLAAEHEKVLSGQDSGEGLKQLKDKLIFLGLAATGTHDQRPTPFSPLFSMVGFQTIVAANIIQSDFMVGAPDWLNYLIIVFLGLAASLMTLRFRAIISISLNVLLVCAYFYANFVFFKNNYIISVFYPLLAVLISYTVITIYQFTSEENEKKVIRRMFQRYVSSRVVDVLLEEPGKIKLGGQRKRLTVFFSDIRGFTSMSEKMPPEEVVSILNEYLTEMIDIIFEYNGTLDKFIGDAIMAVWGAPIEQENHAELAVRAAWAMRKKIEELQKKWESEGKRKIGVGMGINTGDVVVGNMGSDQFSDYTVIGDNVNLAARLEENAGREQLIISETTYEEVKDIVQVKDLEPLKVKGKEKPVHVYEITGLTG